MGKQVIEGKTSIFNAVSLDFLKNLEFLATVEAQINEHSKRWTSQNKGQKVLHRQNLGQILIGKASKGGQTIGGHSN